jgi:hypothetical protein
VALRYTGSADRWQELLEANPGITNPNRVSPGMMLTLPQSWRPEPPEPERTGLMGWAESAVDGAVDLATDVWDGMNARVDEVQQDIQTGVDFVRDAGQAAWDWAFGGDDVVVERGELTSLGEGSDAQTSHVHWPGTDASGVTLGKGYDIGSRTAEEVIADLTAAGMDVTQATAISAGAGLKGDAASAWVNANRDTVGEISVDIQRSLLASQLTVYTERARTNATSTTPNGGLNAASREERDGVEAGTYVLPTEEWDALHPAMHEFLTDLIYQGGYYGYDRIAQINQRLRENHGDQIAQLRAVRELFVGEDGEDSYMDRYAAAIGEGRAGQGQSVTFGDATVDYSGHFRRNGIRLAYLDHVISALESGREVRVE